MPDNGVTDVYVLPPNTPAPPATPILNPPPLPSEFKFTDPPNPSPPCAIAGCLAPEVLYILAVCPSHLKSTVNFKSIAEAVDVSAHSAALILIETDVPKIVRGETKATGV